MRIAQIAVVGLLVSACHTAQPTANSVIDKADLVPRVEACRALQFPRIPSTSSDEMVRYVKALDEQHEKFCTKKGD